MGIWFGVGTCSAVDAIVIGVRDHPPRRGHFRNLEFRLRRTRPRAPGLLSGDVLTGAVSVTVVAQEDAMRLSASAGADMQKAKRTRGGGRGIVLRIDVFPGEPTEISIGVKRTPVLGISEVQRALYAIHGNPTLMVFRSGTLSVGVISEREDPTNHLRLILKDGFAVSAWLNSARSRTSGP